MKISRRNLIATGIGAGAAWGLPLLWQPRSADTGRLVSLGVMPPGTLPQRSGSGAGVISVLDLATGKQQVVPIPFTGAHSLVTLPQGFVIVGNRRSLATTDQNFAKIKVIHAPQGWEFGGHAVWVEARRSLIVGIRPAAKANLETIDRIGPQKFTGRVAEVDLKTLEITIRGSSGGFEPHDMSLLADGRIAIGNYGNKSRHDLNTYRNLQPTLGLLDPRSLDVVEIIDVPNLGSVSHFAEGPAGQYALLPARLQAITPQSLTSLRSEMNQTSFSLAAVELVEGKIGSPSPVLTYQTNTSGPPAWQSHLVAPGKQRRPQSICFHNRLQCWFVTYPFSESIMRIGVDGSAQIFSAFRMGVSYPRGIAVGPEDSIFVSGQYRGVVQIDGSTGKTIGKWDINNFDATHLFTLT